jgi:hypothetical protein
MAEFFGAQWPVDHHVVPEGKDPDVLTKVWAALTDFGPSVRDALIGQSLSDPRFQIFDIERFRFAPQTPLERRPNVLPASFQVVLIGKERRQACVWGEIHPATLELVGQKPMEGFEFARQLGCHGNSVAGYLPLYHTATPRARARGEISRNQTSFPRIRTGLRAKAGAARLAAGHRNSNVSNSLRPIDQSKRRGVISCRSRVDRILII